MSIGNELERNEKKLTTSVLIVLHERNGNL